MKSLIQITVKAYILFFIPYIIISEVSTSQAMMTIHQAREVNTEDEIPNEGIVQRPKEFPFREECIICFENFRSTLFQNTCNDKENRHRACKGCYGKIEKVTGKCPVCRAPLPSAQAIPVHVPVYHDSIGGGDIFNISSLVDHRFENGILRPNAETAFGNIPENLRHRQRYRAFTVNSLAEDCNDRGGKIVFPFPRGTNNVACFCNDKLYKTLPLQDIFGCD